MNCSHDHLKFTDGHFAFKCIDCDQTWNAVDVNGAPALELKGHMPQPFRETRHDRYVLPRTEKPTQYKALVFKKPK